MDAIVKTHEHNDDGPSDRADACSHGKNQPTG